MPITSPARTAGWGWIAVIDVAYLDAGGEQVPILTETATSIILNPAREHQAMLPPRREDVKPPIRK